RQGRDWNRDGQTEWTFGSLPRSCKTSAGALAYPALVDQSEAVGLRLFDTNADAALAHIEGVRRLLGIQIRDKLAWLSKNHGLTPPALAAWTARGSAHQLLEDLAWSSLAAVADVYALNVRDKATFDGLLNNVRRELGAVFQARSSLLEEVLTGLSALGPALQALQSSHPDVANDLAGLLDDLLYQGFLLELGPDRLAHFPRYLDAMQVRLTRLGEDPRRDAGLVARLDDYWQRYLDYLAAGNEYDLALDEYRWLCHEFRVSLFAQHLGTAQKVSPKRLEQAWQAVVNAA
ncbi:MAG: DUF3418 domain-containing protein, partial [Xanthomonadales bacterium]|nr:DUF3418 domain-containing protein [Xanthomonadales bacterium]